MQFTENRKNGLVYMTAPDIKVPHAFTTRFGGVSRGIYESLNLTFSHDDDPACVRENYRLLGLATGIDTSSMAFTHQVHGNTVRLCTPGDIHTLETPIPYDADGLVTGCRGLGLICFTADCVPVLLWDEKNRAIGAVHCGWRSSVLDILANALSLMGELGAPAEDIHAAIGPSIGACCFQVGYEVVEAAQALVGPCPGLWHPQAGHEGKYLLDLRGVNRLRLIQLGLRPENISVSGECTMCMSGKYWSHRKTMGRRGVQAALIVLP